MVIATFSETTGWAGKTITRQGEAFILEGHGTIAASDVMAYDKQGHLSWANEGTRAWVGSLARRQAATGQQAPRPAQPGPASSTVAQALGSSEPGTSRAGSPAGQASSSGATSAPSAYSGRKRNLCSSTQ